MRAFSEKEFSRTSFVKAGGALVVGFSLGAAGVAARAGGTQAASVASAPLGGPWSPVQLTSLDSWLRIAQDGKVTVYTGGVENGQGRATAYAQIVAEELDAPFEAVSFVMGDTALTPEQGSSGSSRGIRIQAQPLRYAAAEARLLLLNLASTRFAVPTSQLTVSDGVVSVASNSSQRVSYGELIGAQRLNLTLNPIDVSDRLGYVAGSALAYGTGKAQLKSPAAYKLIGKPTKRVDIPAKVTGAYTYVQNVRLPGMVHARLVLPPSPSSRLVRINGFKGRKFPGLVKVVSKGNFVAVVTEQEWQAIEAMHTLEAVWTDSESTLPTNKALYTALRQAPRAIPDVGSFRASPVRGGIANPNRGTVDAALAGAAKRLQADYHFPVQAHGSIGPSCAVATVSGDQAVVWCPTYNPGTTRSQIAGVLGFPVTNVRAIWFEGSGQYGRGGSFEDMGPAAAFISQAVGRPVRLTLMRDQDFLTDPYGLPFSFRLRGGVDNDGNVVAWDTEMWTWAVNPQTEGPTLTAMLTGSAAAGAFREQGEQGLGGGDMSTYEFPNESLVIHSIAPSLRVGGGNLRSPKRFQLNFATESFIDELAATAGVDPIAFRLQQLQNTQKVAATASPNLDQANYTRAIAMVNTVKEASKWQSRPSPAPTARAKSSEVVTGRGVATMGNYTNVFAALVAEVEVNLKTGRVRAKKMTQAVDPGTVINPTAARGSLEQAIIFALSRTLHEEVKFDDKQVLSHDWVTYPILRFLDVPDQQTVLVSRPEYWGGGLGEGPEILVPAAVANAIFDATGVRLRQVPFTPTRVRAALKAAGVA
jgi:nicotinate dehydrogenase subunit B